MKATEQKVLKFIKDNNLIADGDKILIALSGGPDSVFLLHFFLKYKKKYKIKIGAVHINHQLRGSDSERDEMFCEAICNELNVPLFVKRANVKVIAKRTKSSLELAGRKIRYDFFEKILSSEKFDKIATAHNADDNAETVMLNLIKGAGIKGISGIPVKRGNIVRPVLCLSKSDILKYLDVNKYEYRFDESNLSDEYERNILRNNIIPLIKKNLNPAFDDAVLNSALNFQRLNLFVEKLLSELKTKISVKKGKLISIPTSLINDKDEFLITQLIKNLVDENLNVKSELSDVNKIISLKSKQVGKSEELSGNLIVFRERNAIIISRKKISSDKNGKVLTINTSVKIGDKTFSVSSVSKDSILMGKSKNIEYISGDNVSGEFIVRKWKSGDKFYPLGLNGTKKLSDYLTEIKIDSLTKKDQLVLLNNDKIVWVIGHRIDDRFKITDNTKKVLKLCLI